MIRRYLTYKCRLSNGNFIIVRMGEYWYGSAKVSPTFKIFSPARFKTEWRRCSFEPSYHSDKLALSQVMKIIKSDSVTLIGKWKEPKNDKEEA